MKEYEIKPIGVMRTDFKEKFGIPRQSGRVKSAKGKIELFAPFRCKEALEGLSEFSYIWIIFDFSMSHQEKFQPSVRPPRLGGNKKVGVFASRSPFRPNSLGLSSVKLESVNDDLSITVSGVDLLDNTPIFDIKPYVPYSDIHDDAFGSFSDKNKNHRLIISDGEEFLSIIPNDLKKTAIDCLCDDPRPAYQNDNQRIYNMHFANYDIHFKVNNNDISIISVDII